MQSLWMLAAALCFSLMAVCVKLLGNHYSAHEVLFYRCLLSTLGVAGFVLLRKMPFSVKNWRLHIRRALLATFSMGVWYFTISKLSLAVAVTLNYASPIFLAVLVITRRSAGTRAPQWAFLLAIVVGFTGVLLLADPQGRAEDLRYILLGAVGAFCAALAFQDIGKLASAGESETQMVFFFSFFATLFSGILLPFGNVTAHTGASVALLCGVAFFATLGQFWVSRAYGKGHPLFAAALQYSGVVFSSIWGYLLWQESLGMRSLSGIALIIASSVLVTILTRRRSAARMIPPAAAAERSS